LLKTGWPGWMQRDEQRISTPDLPGPGFTLLTGDERWRAAATSAPVALQIGVSVHCIADNGWAAVTGLARDGALLVRPDDLVGWRSDVFPADPQQALRQAVSQLLSRRRIAR
jgi:putative polyketide hydroxylase